MWALYLLRLALHALLDIWLSGSLVLPFMLLLRWGRSKWRGLGVAGAHQEALAFSLGMLWISKSDCGRGVFPGQGFS